MAFVINVSETGPALVRGHLGQALSASLLIPIWDVVMLELSISLY